MLVIRQFDLPRDVGAIATSTGLASTTDGFTLANDAIVGEFYLPMTPHLSKEVVGLEVWPLEDQIEIAVCWPGDPVQYAQWDEVVSHWEPSGFPIYYRVEELRQQLTQWPGAIGLTVRLVRLDGVAPTVSRIKIAFDFLSSLSAYAVEFGLKPYLEGLFYELPRFVTPTTETGPLPTPTDMDSELIEAARLLAPGRKIIDTSVVDGVITPNENLQVGSTYQAQIAYRPLVDVADGIYQISAVPTILIYYGDRTNERHARVEDSIQMANNISRLWSATFEYDQIMTLEVIAATLQDAQLIADRAIGSLCQRELIDLPAYDIQVGVSVIGGIRTAAESRDSVNLYRVTARLLLSGLVEGEVVTDVPTITSTEINSTPQ